MNVSQKEAQRMDEQRLVGAAFFKIEALSLTIEDHPHRSIALMSEHQPAASLPAILSQ